MYFVKNLQDFRVYKRRKIFFDFEKTKDKSKGTLVVSLSRDLKDSVRIQGCGAFYPQYLRSFFVPKKTLSKTLYRKRTGFLPQSDHYKATQEAGGKFANYKVMVKDYSGKNLLYDLSLELNHFYDAYGKASPTVMLSAFRNFLQEVCASDVFAQYPDRYLFVPFDKIDQIDREMNDKRSESFPALVALMYKLKLVGPDFLKGYWIIFFDHSTKSYFKFQMGSLADSKSFVAYKTACKKLNAGVFDEEDTEEAQGGNAEAEPEEKKNRDGAREVERRQREERVRKVRVGLGLPNPDKLTAAEREIVSAAEERIGDVTDENPDASVEDLVKRLDEDERMAQYARELEEIRTAGRRAEVAAKLKEKYESAQGEIEFKGIKVREITSRTELKILERKQFPIETLNEEVKGARDLSASYVKELKDEDTIRILKSFNSDPDFPMYLERLETVDNSDYYNRTERLKMVFVDADRKRHQVSLDVPKLVGNEFIFLNGNKKNIIKQLIKLPITKTKPDACELVTNYNKFILERFGQNAHPSISKLWKFLEGALWFEGSKKVKVVPGDVSSSCDSKSVEVAELSASLAEVRAGEFSFVFSSGKLKAEIDSGNYKHYSDGIAKGLEAVGTVSSGGVVFVNPKDGSVLVDDKEHSKGIADSIAMAIDSAEPGKSHLSNYASAAPSASKAFSRVMITGNKIPLIVVLGVYRGLVPVLDAYGVKYEIASKKKDPKATTGLGHIRFEDAHLYYEDRPLGNCLLLNGLKALDTRHYELRQFNGKEPYLSYFQDEFGSVNIAKGVMNCLDLMVDPITLDVLRRLGLPEDVVGCLLHMNTLLADRDFRKPSDMGNYRIRGPELINAYLYKVLADAYREFKDAKKAGKRNPKFSVTPNRLIAKLLEEPVIEEYSVLNPVLECEKLGSYSQKGIGGVNLDKAYTLPLRAFDKSMKGFTGLNHPESASVGIVRFMTSDPEIVNARGFIRPGISEDDITAMQILTPAELLSPFTSRHSDPPRQTMQAVQAKHLMPTVKMTRPLVTSGMHKAIPHMIGSDFVYKAKKDGYVREIDAKTQMMFVEYKDGSRDAVDLSSVQSKNSSGGFYISNQKVTDLKADSKFKAGDILAYNKDFFSKSKDGETFLSAGFLAKIALTTNWSTLEDGSSITAGLSDSLITEVTMHEKVVLGPSSNVDFIVKVGDHVRSGDALMIVERSFEDENATRLLDRLGKDFKTAISDLSKNRIVSQWSGEIVDVVVSYNRPLAEFSPSVKRIIMEYARDAEDRKSRVLKKLGKDAEDRGVQNSTLFKNTEMVQSDRIRGIPVDGVLIEFFIKHKDHLSLGDKVSFDKAVKSIVCEVISKGKEPYSEADPSKEVSALVSPFSPVNRLTVDFYIQMYVNKALVELKKKIKDILS